MPRRAFFRGTNNSGVECLWLLHSAAQETKGNLADEGFQIRANHIALVVAAYGTSLRRFGAKVHMATVQAQPGRFSADAEQLPGFQGVGKACEALGMGALNGGNGRKGIRNTSKAFLRAIRENSG